MDTDFPCARFDVQGQHIQKMGHTLRAPRADGETKRAARRMLYIEEALSVLRLFFVFICFSSSPRPQISHLPLHKRSLLSVSLSRNVFFLCFRYLVESSQAEVLLDRCEVVSLIGHVVELATVNLLHASESAPLVFLRCAFFSWAAFHSAFKLCSHC